MTGQLRRRVSKSVCRWVLACGFCLLVSPLYGYDRVVPSSSQQGLLTWSCPTSGVVSYRVEWSPGREGASWHDLACGGEGLAPTGGTMSAAVPAFFRVCASVTDGTPAVEAPVIGALTRLGVLVWRQNTNGVLAQRIEWSPRIETAVWADLACGAGLGSPTGSTMSADVPTCFRVRAMLRDTTNSFLQIPSVAFDMGNAMSPEEGDADELPVHRVLLSAFAVDAHETTKERWDDVAAWASAHGYDIGPTDALARDGNHPVFGVTWFECVKWCNARSEKEGLLPCYTNSHGVYREGEVDPECDWDANGYRLPSEAEWEAAARGGAAGRRFPWGDSDTIQHERANYSSDASLDYDTSATRGYHPAYVSEWPPYTSPVGSFPPNGIGLYDAAGNVWEWCWDWYDASYYAASPAIDPRGPSAGPGRVVRGGGWDNGPANCRNADRDVIWPGDGSEAVGFRTVRSVE